jgi:hypothetical protein
VTTSGAVTAAAGLAGTLGLGVALGLQFNPLTSLVGATIAAALYGFPAATQARRALAVAVLAGAWLVGEGAGIGRRLAESPPRTPAEWLPIAAWALVGLAVGYAAPAAAGALAGRRVIRGTGWLSAGAVAFAVAGAIALAAPTLADGVARIGGGS